MKFVTFKAIVSGVICTVLSFALAFAFRNTTERSFGVLFVCMLVLFVTPWAVINFEFINKAADRLVDFESKLSDKWDERAMQKKG